MTLHVEILGRKLFIQARLLGLHLLLCLLQFRKNLQHCRNIVTAFTRLTNLPWFANLWPLEERDHSDCFHESVSFTGKTSQWGGLPHLLVAKEAPRITARTGVKILSPLHYPEPFLGRESRQIFCQSNCMLLTSIPRHSYLVCPPLCQIIVEHSGNLFRKHYLSVD